MIAVMFQRSSVLSCALSGFAVLSILLMAQCNTCATDFDCRGGQFLGFTSFSKFERSKGESPGELVLTSPVIEAALKWDELIASWNVEKTDATYLKVEARALYADHATKYFVMGKWSAQADRFPRECVLQQKDEDGDVSTDTLILRQPTQRFQIRLTLGGEGNLKPKLKFLGISVTDTTATLQPLPPNHSAWGKTIPVPERSQMAYPNGKVLCSPTTVSMIMTYWAKRLKRPEMDKDVPEVVKAVYDANWKGTGNWPFNMAYAGSYPGVRAYVTRMSDLAELEDWIAAGVPVGLSLCYDRLRGKGPGPNGHLVVCVGFTPEGDPIINDPGTSKNVRKIFPRKNLLYAWAYSHNAAYMIYPENAEVPRDRFGHWQSWTSRKRIAFE
jgi:Peptidase_C39 like family